MNIQLKLFAKAKELAGSDVVQLELPADATLKTLKVVLCAQYPQLAKLADQLLYAIDNDYADETTVITESSEVACFPPVSGG